MRQHSLFLYIFPPWLLSPLMEFIIEVSSHGTTCLPFDEYSHPSWFKDYKEKETYKLSYS